MKYCTHCGNPVEDDAKFCVACGQPIAERSTESDFFDDSHESESADFFADEHSSVRPEEDVKVADAESKNNERASVFLRIISFLFPIVGLILYCVWNKEYKRKAKDVGIPALIGFIIGFVLEMIYYVVIMMQ